MLCKQCLIECTVNYDILNIRLLDGIHKNTIQRPGRTEQWKFSSNLVVILFKMVVHWFLVTKHFVTSNSLQQLFQNIIGLEIECAIIKSQDTVQFICVMRLPFPNSVTISDTLLGNGKSITQ